MNYIDDFAEDATVYFQFTTNDRQGGAVAPSTAFEAADVLIYKNNGATQKATTNGITMTSPFDSVTGLHALTIDTSVDTGDAGFWTTGSDYICVLSPDETVDAQTVVAVIGSFSIQNRYMRGTNSAALASDLATVAGYLDTEIAAILADTNELQTDWVNGGRLDLILDARASQTSVDTVDTVVDAILVDTGTDGVVIAAASKTGYSLSAAGITAIWAEIMEGAITAVQMMRGFASALLGKASGLATTTAVYRDLADSKDRITATVDSDGNRSAVTRDLT